MHVVKQGENFWTIARSYYGTGNAYLALWYANHERVPAPDALAVGTTIDIPPRDQLDASMMGAAALTPNNPPERPGSASGGADSTRVEPMLAVGGKKESPSPAQPRHSEPRPRYHEVTPHETLRSIARDRLGDANREYEIQRLNRDVLGENDRPRVGMRLRLPAGSRRR